MWLVVFNNVSNQNLQWQLYYPCNINLHFIAPIQFYGGELMECQFETSAFFLVLQNPMCIQFYHMYPYFFPPTTCTISITSIWSPHLGMQREGWYVRDGHHLLLPFHVAMLWYSMQWDGISRCVMVWHSMAWFVRDGHHLLLSPSSIFRPITSDGQPPLTSCLLVCRRHSCSTYTTLQQLQDCSTGICCFCRFYTPQWNIECCALYEV